ncbi:hypothetical protein BH11PSE2_BH11PSE2_00190 [soil metagenome]
MPSALIALLLAAAQLTAANLTGLTEAAAKEKLGAPDVARREAGGALWTYRKEGCVLFVYLVDKGQGLQVSGLSTGPRRTGEAAPSVEVCLAQPKP